MKTTVAAALLALAAFDAEGAVTRARYLMGTVCEVTTGTEREIDAAFAEAARVESMLSTWRDDTELARLNRAGSMQVSPELRALLRESVDWSEKTGGAFNPLVAPLLDVWKTRGDGALPSAEALQAARKRTAIANAKFSDAVTLANGAEFEEGAFGKGYAIDRMLARIDSREAVINFGGQLGVRGATSVTIADPEHRDTPVLAFTVSNGSLSTSSGSEKQFTIDGRTLTHILDPRSGEALPPRGSASAIADDALAADILSTALYVMGEDEGLRWANVNDVAAIFITSTKHIRLSSAARARLRDLAVLDRNFTIKD